MELGELPRELAHQGAVHASLVCNGLVQLQQLFQHNFGIGRPGDVRCAGPVHRIHQHVLGEVGTHGPDQRADGLEEHLALRAVHGRARGAPIVPERVHLVSMLLSSASLDEDGNQSGRDALPRAFQRLVELHGVPQLLRPHAALDDHLVHALVERHAHTVELLVEGEGLVDLVHLACLDEAADEAVCLVASFFLVGIAGGPTGLLLRLFPCQHFRRCRTSGSQQCVRATLFSIRRRRTRSTPASAVMLQRSGRIIIITWRCVMRLRDPLQPMVSLLRGGCTGPFDHMPWRQFCVFWILETGSDLRHGCRCHNLIAPRTLAHGNGLINKHGVCHGQPSTAGMVSTTRRRPWWMIGSGGACTSTVRRRWSVPTAAAATTAAETAAPL
mmetsp:Transcript_43271/g.123805  ORF Transcript_43271/g.123805 Transcript_43271/m.123805 type:complete len:385 (+) Transcript_43271:339-1493(+)